MLPIMVHGDAAFAGQGVVAETLNLSQLRGYRTGGTIHVVVNNQVGFTTAPSSSRSSVYSTDVAKMIQAPVFHVNGDDPEAVVRVGQLAYEFRQRFHKDVVIDMVCYRRRGHNEGDDPSMTQPLMYNLIEAKRSVRKLYTEALIGRGDITEEEAEQLLRDYQERLERVFAETHAAQTSPIPIITADSAAVSDLERPHGPAGRRRRQHARHPRRSPPRRWPASARRTSTIPEGFTVHPKLKQLLEKREQMSREGGIDWGFGELAAFGSLLMEGVPVRLAGQDSRRGTFVQRHAVFHDRANGDEWTPLANLSRRPGQAVDLRLAAVRIRGHGLRIRLLGGAPGRPGALGGPVRRLRQRRPDHHRRVHLLRRAEVGPALLAGADAAARLRGPGPGPLLRPHRALPADVRRGEHDRGQPDHAGLALPPAAPPGLQPAAQAADHLHAEAAAAPEGRGLLGGGLHHRHASGRSSASTSSCTANAVERVLLVSGRLYYDLLAARQKTGDKKTAIVRVEQLYPLPAEEIDAELAKYPNADVVWAQDEPANQGPWPFIGLNLPQALDRRCAWCPVRPRPRPRPARRSATPSSRTPCSSRHSTPQVSSHGCPAGVDATPAGHPVFMHGHPARSHSTE